MNLEKSIILGINFEDNRLAMLVRVVGCLVDT